MFEKLKPIGPTYMGFRSASPDTEPVCWVETYQGPEGSPIYRVCWNQTYLRHCARCQDCKGKPEEFLELLRLELDCARKQLQIECN